MGRAYEVRKASIQKTGAARGKVYSLYAKEIYQAAKNGGTEVTSNANLKRLIERAKKEQVPSDIIKRAIDKVNSGVDENYQQTTYEMFGPSGSTLVIDKSDTKVHTIVPHYDTRQQDKTTITYTRGVKQNASKTQE